MDLYFEIATRGTVIRYLLILYISEKPQKAEINPYYIYF